MAKYIARCRLTLHDNLYYASRELGRAYETEKFLHNYGLTYALGLVKPAPAYFNDLQVPRYQTELSAERVGACYVTPARPLQVDFAFITFKMATVPYYAFTPQVIENRVVFGRAKELAPCSTFEFFVLAETMLKLPRWVRLGKWMAKAEVFVKWYRLGSDAAKLGEAGPNQPQVVDCPLNPLDIARQRLFSYDVVAMPPVSLLANPSVTGAYCRLVDDPKWLKGESGDLVEVVSDDAKRAKRVLYVPLEMTYFGGEGASK